MSSAQQVLPLQTPIPAGRARRPRWHFRLQGSDTAWAIAFVVPYVAVFVAFVAYPVVFGLWMGSRPTLYTLLFSDPRYIDTLINTRSVACHERATRVEWPGTSEPRESSHIKDLG